MAITSIAVIIHHRTSAGGKRRLPRSPNTLIGVWLYLAGSGLARHVKPDSDEQTADPLDQRGLVKKYDSGRYAFARAVGVDGIYRWTIDEAARLHSARPETLQQPQHHQHQNQSSRPISQRTNDSHGANKMLEATNYDQFRQQQPHTQHSLQRKPLPVPKSAYWQQQQNNHQGQWQHQQQDYPPRPAHQQFEAQAKSSVKQTPQGGFEPLRPTNQIRLPDNRTLQGSQTTQPQYQYSASEQPQQMQESNRFIYRPPALSVRTRANGIWSGSNQYTRYGTDNAG
ncbi:hypothetical protein H2198_010186 [Neophaeococcomyces mojaviensis]|uniref:Uncharacterized protein n=1 Tax=Neophaeococcomyces mojaviensis TaxID=3383035 RepID=A0ACC2ZSF2_9EURO|nr:hypothetical protein H2198_010186 [Knufia sp. JES_112]